MQNNQLKWKRVAGTHKGESNFMEFDIIRSSMGGWSMFTFNAWDGVELNHFWKRRLSSVKAEAQSFADQEGQ